MRSVGLFGPRIGPKELLHSPEELARHLDTHDDGTPFVVQVDSEDRATECLQMLAGALDGQATIVLTNVTAKTTEDFSPDLRERATTAHRTRVFGKIGSQISGRMCWLLSFGESPPQMSSKVASPLKPAALDRESYTLRLSYQWLYGTSAWDKVRRHPVIVCASG